MHLVIQALERLGRPVRQLLIVCVNAGEGRVHRAPPVVMSEETIESAAHRASGSSTQRRSRNDSSTALINSCTWAPSSKFPSFTRLSLKSSVMKELTRFA